MSMRVCSIVVGVLVPVLALAQPPYQTGWPVDNVIGGVLFDRLDGGDWSIFAEVASADMTRYDTTGTESPWPSVVSSSGLMLQEFHRTCVGDMDGDGHDEIVVAQHGGYKVYVFSSIDGSTLPGWPRVIGELTSWWVTQMVLADLDGDGDMELVSAGARDDPFQLQVYVYQHDGTQLEGWPQTVWTEPDCNVAGLAVGDVDFDGDNEVVASVDHWDGGWAPSPVYVFEHDGQIREGWPSQPDSIPGFMRNCRIADLDGDGSCEIIGTTGTSLAVMNLDGSTRWVVYSGPSFFERPAIGDLDGDGVLDVVAGGNDGIIAWSDAVGDLGSWTDPTLGSFSGYSIADVDGDGASEVAVFARTAGVTNDIYLLSGDLEVVPGYPIENQGEAISGRFHTHFLDLDEDGDLEFAFTANKKIHIFDLPPPTGGGPALVEWSGFNGKPTGSAYYHEGRNVPHFVRGDANSDGTVDVTDAVVALGYLFQDTPVGCLRALDANGDDVVDITDPIVTLVELFGLSGSTVIPHPYPRCGRAIDGPAVPCDTPLAVSSCP